MKIVVISDIHLHPWSAFSTGDGASNSRLLQTIKVVEESLKYALKNNAPWICAGDMIHTIGFVDNAVLNIWIKLLRDYHGVKKFAISGNHDTRGRGGILNENESVLTAFAEADPNFYILDGGQVQMWHDGPTIYGTPATPKGQPIHLGPGGDIGLFHGIVEGSITASGYVLPHSLPLKELQDLYKISIVGDIHHPQKFPGVLIPGAPEHHNFGDHGDRGWWVVEMDTDPPAMLQRVSDSPQFLTVTSVEDVRDDGNFYRVKGEVTGPLPPNATAVASPPTIVQSREPVSGDVGDFLRRWMKEAKPPGDSTAVFNAGMELMETSGEILSPRPARLLFVEARNFMCYEHLTHQVLEGTTLVTGQSRDFTSNGAGKSTIFEAMYWCLFGKTTKGVAAEEVIRDGAKICTVRLIIDLGGKALTIERVRDVDGVKVTAHLDGVAIEGASTIAVTRKVCARLGLTPEIFRALGYYSQEKVFLFSRATDAERKEVLSDLVGLSVLQTASAGAGSEYADITQRVEKDQTILDEKEHNLIWATSSVTQAIEKDESWQQEMMQKIEDADFEIEVLEGGGSNRWLQDHATETEGKITELEYTIVRNQQRYETESKLAEAEDLIALRDEKLGEERVLSELAKKYKDALFKRVERQGACTRATTLLEKYQGLEPGEACPLCNQEVDQSHIDMMIEAVTSELDEAVANWREADAFSDGLNKELEDQGKVIGKIQDRLDDISKWIRVRDASQGIIEQNKATLEIYRTQLEDLGRQAIQLVSDRVAILKKEPNPYADAMKDWIEQESSLAGDIHEIKEEIKLGTAELDILKYWKKGFGKQGLQSIMLDSLAGDFNAIRSDVFPVLTRGVFDVQFSTLSTTQTGEVREKTDFYIQMHGRRVSYNSLSGGQRRRIDVGTMLCLALAQSKMWNTPGVLGMLILDEIFDFLDVDGAEAVCEVLEEINAVIPSIYVVSQRTEMKSLFPQQLEVIQGDDGISRIAS